MVPGVAPAPSKQLAARCRRLPRVMPSIAMRPTTTSSALGGDGGDGGMGGWGESHMKYGKNLIRTNRIS